MSIINDTLTRLEGEQRAGSPTPRLITPAPRRSGIPMMVLAGALLLVFAATGLLAWQGPSWLAAKRHAEPQLADHVVAAQPSAAPVQPSTPVLLASADSAAAKETSVAALHKSGAAAAENKPVQPIASPPAAPVVAAAPVPTQPAPVQKSPVHKARLASSVPAETQHKAVSHTAARQHRAEAVAARAEHTHRHTLESRHREVAARHRHHAVAVVPHRHTRVRHVAPVRRTHREGIYQVDRAVALAREAISRGEFHSALDKLRAISPAPTRRADYWLLMGSARLGLKQFGRAEQALDSGRHLAPGSVDIAVQLAILKQQIGDNQGALKILKQAAIDHPDAPQVFLNQGYSRVEVGELGRAVQSFNTFLRLTQGSASYAGQREAVMQWLAQLQARESQAGQ